jgi:hypothetical protein
MHDRPGGEDVMTEPTEQTRGIDTLVPHPRNYNQHPPEQIERLAASLQQFGQVRPIVVHRNTIIAGHGVYLAAQHLGYQTLRVTQLPDDWTDEQAMAYLVADNETRRGAEPSDTELAALLDELRPSFDLNSLGFDEQEYGALLDRLTPDLPVDTGITSGARPSPRVLPIDLIYTLQMADCTCCLAVQAGWKYGIQSAQYRLCPYTNELSGRHEVVFIDNDYFNYDHAVHLDAVRQLRPKYATVRDVMTPEQCQVENIQHYSLDQILDWAAELQQYAENVIVIPKYDCIDQIPEHYVLGYSVPTSHGGTPLSVSLFASRRVHLLGGSWKAQLEHLAALGDAVVSIDNNHIQRMARQFGQFDDGDGHMRQLQYIGCGSANNPRYVALALSFGLIAAKVNELHSTSAQAPIDAQLQEVM